MSFRFFRRVRVAPGLSVNLSRSGPSLSVGVRGAHVTVGRRGVTRTIGLPGRGLFCTSRIGLHSGYHSATKLPPATIRMQQQAANRHVELAIVLVTVLLIGLGAIAGWWLAQ
jgi:hypothetical protein